MAYATQADIVAIYPDALTRIALDRSVNPPVVDANLVSAALDHASALCDMRLSQRYALPLTPIPAIVKGYTIDIAIYRMALTRDKLTAEMRQRYEDAVADLRDIAAGKAGIGNVAVDTSGNTSISGGADSNEGTASFGIMRRQG